MASRGRLRLVEAAAAPSPAGVTVLRSEARALLGLTPGASTDEIAAAFRRRASRAHPDRGGDAEEMVALVEARDALLARHIEGGRVVVVDDRLGHRIVRALRTRGARPPRVV